MVSKLWRFAAKLEMNQTSQIIKTCRRFEPFQDDFIACP